MLSRMLLFGGLTLPFLSVGPLAADDAAKIEYFETHIRPVLIKHCYECHAEDSEEVGGGLLLDSRDGWLLGGDSGPAIKPGSDHKSLLIEALEYETVEMPPEGRLPEETIEKFRKWIRDGAIDPRRSNVKAHKAAGINIEARRSFWSFQQPAETPTPIVPGSNWANNDIDRFIEQARLDAKLPYPGDADPIVALRRLCFDLTGLPPSVEMIRQFGDQPSRELWIAYVDRLIESPAFAEHWGRHWLDVARYADSNGSDFNATFHNAWRYRDFVVQSMASDKPFDHFVRQQIAGDLMPAETDAERSENLVATGFLMLGAKMLSERDKTKLRMDIVDEQIDTVGRAFLGMTLGCARCHDHKFDPIPTADYYALAGIFRSTKTLDGESQKYVSKCLRRPLPASESQIAENKKYQDRKKEIDKQLAAAKKHLAKVRTSANQSFEGIVIDDTQAEKIGDWTNSTISPNYVGAGYIHDGNKNKGETRITYKAKLAAGKYEVRLSYTGNGGRAAAVPIEIETADGTKHLKISQRKKPPIDDLWMSLGEFKFSDKKPAVVTMRNDNTRGHVIADAVQFINLDQKEAQQKLANKNKDADGSEDSANPNQLISAATARVKELEKAKASHAKTSPQPLPQALAVIDEKKIEDANLCIRGEVHNQGEKVPRGFLQVVSRSSSIDIPNDQSGRLQLAQWITDPDNPLTARVIVNRIWMHLLGEGIVRSVDNFGQLGDRPTHPELLDSLSSEFVRNGWSIKTLIRKIVNSRVYQQSANFNAAAFKIDPENRLLWRSNRRRIPAEALRDTMLIAGDALDRTSSRRPMINYGTLVNSNTAKSGPSGDQDSPRRSMYLKIIRGQVPTMLATFDFADPDVLVGKRTSTNVPTQALVMLNNPFVIKSAADIAKRIFAQTGDNEKRIEVAYLLCLQRYPSSEDREAAKAFLQSESQFAQFIQILLASTEYRYLD